MSEIFINYRNDDDRFVALLVDDRLRTVFGDDNVFRDSRTPVGGSEFPPELWRRVVASRVVLPFIGKQWLTLRATSGGRRIDDPRDFVRTGIEAALAVGKRVVPVLLNGAVMPAAADLPPTLRGLTAQRGVRLGVRTSNADLAYLVEQVATSLSVIDRGKWAIPKR
ncbi:hypothetical protein ACWKSP_39070 [Micromonosporaceae bacterium Da 78-11]